MKFAKERSFDYKGKKVNHVEYFLVDFGKMFSFKLY